MQGFLASEYTYMKSLDRLLVTHVYIFRLREADTLVTVKLVKPLLCQIIVFSFTGKLSKVIPLILFRTCYYEPELSKVKTKHMQPICNSTNNWLLYQLRLDFPPVSRWTEWRHGQAARLLSTIQYGGPRVEFWPSLERNFSGFGCTLEAKTTVFLLTISKNTPSLEWPSPLVRSITILPKINKQQYKSWGK